MKLLADVLKTPGARVARGAGAWAVSHPHQNIYKEIMKLNLFNNFPNKKWPLNKFATKNEQFWNSYGQIYESGITGSGSVSQMTVFN
jgi:hypothetical protein